jgi:hypothetical protein
MRTDLAALGGLVVLAVAARYALPRLASKGRLALRRATGITHTSGAARSGVPPAVDPARGIAG